MQCNGPILHIHIATLDDYLKASLAQNKKPIRCLCAYVQAVTTGEVPKHANITLSEESRFYLSHANLQPSTADLQTMHT